MHEYGSTVLITTLDRIVPARERKANLCFRIERTSHEPKHTTLRMQLQPVFRCFSLNALDPGSEREIPVICHDPGAWHGYVTPES